MPEKRRRAIIEAMSRKPPNQFLAPLAAAIDRRALLTNVLGLGGAAAGFAILGGGIGLAGLAGGGCNSDDGTTTPDGNDTPDGNTAGDWATGGTAAMTGTYDDPFANETGDACVITPSATLGPCYAATLARQDVSEAQPGLPMRLALRVVNSDGCTPVAGATVDIWHTDRRGIYSGEDAASMCNNNDALATSTRYFRGTQTTDANGRVDFDSCFPGWYSGRAIHVHFQVRVGNQEYVTSQLSFDQALIQELFSSHPDYQEFGQPNTPNASDGIIGGANAAKFLVNSYQLPDGALMAYKTITVS